LPEPKNKDIDIGRYDDHEMRLAGEPVMIKWFSDRLEEE